MEDLGQALEACIVGLRRYAIALVRNKDEADDLVQESLARAVARGNRWREVRNPRAYLFSTLHNVYIDKCRKSARAGIHLSFDLADPARMSCAATQDGRLEMRDLGRALAQLPDQQRQIVLLVGLEGMSYQEVGEVLSIPVGTVMSRLFRARKSLRRLMAGDSPSHLRRVV